jgi:hypothetical protein
MAAKAGTENTTDDEIWYSEAVELLAARCGGVKDAEQRLLAGLKDGRIPWSHLQKDGTRCKGDAVFWGSKAGILNVNRAENSVGYTELIIGTFVWQGNSPPYIEPTVTPDLPDDVFGIKVSRTATLALVPVTAAEPTTKPTQPGPEPEIAMEAADTAMFAAKKKKKGKAQLRIAEAAKKLWPPDGIVPPDVGPASLKHAIEALDKREAEARSAASGKKEKPPDPPSWPSCKRFLMDQRGT